MKTQTSRMLLGTALSAMAVTLLIGCSKTPDGAPMVLSPPIAAATVVDDAVITSGVKTALLADPGIKSFDISVLTYKGEVQLTGFVNNQSQIDQASTIARAVEGAGSVKNELMIKP
jgi:hyperosmotically inducible periplasmic protein